MAAVGNVLIVGGGPAGLCAATVLTKRGVEVEVVEINAEIRPLGSGLTMNGVSLRALKMVDEDALERCVRDGAGHPALTFCDVDGKVLNRIVKPQVAGPQYPGGFGIMRPLFWGLLAETAERFGAQIRLQTTVSAIQQRADAVDVEFSDGSRASYDLVVGADGLHSRVRELAFPQAPQPCFTGQTVWRAVVPRPADSDNDIAMYYGRRNKAGCNPVSETQRGGTRFGLRCGREHAEDNAPAARGVAESDPRAVGGVRRDHRLGARADDRPRQDRPAPAARDPDAASVAPRARAADR